MNQWNTVADYIRSQVGERTFKTWFDPIGVLSFTADSIDLEVPNRFYLSWLTDKYVEIIRQSLFHVTRRRIDIRFHVSTPSFSSNDSSSHASASESDAGVQMMRNFVVSQENQFLYDAVAEFSQTTRYTPLYIYGPKGTGKTHLLRAVQHHILSSSPELKVSYFSGDNFVAAVDEHLRSETLPEFRIELSSVDVFLFDDIQVLSNRYYQQQEFQYIISYLQDSEKRLAFSADRLPIEIPALMESIRSRITSGLILQLLPPDSKTKMRILRIFCAVENVQLSDEVIEYLSRLDEFDMEKLHQYAVRLGAFASIEGKPIDVRTAEEVIKHHTRDVKMEVTKINETVAHYFNVTPQDILSAKKNRTVATARRVAMYFCRLTTDLSFSQIGSLFMGKDHSTVLKAYKRVLTDLSTDAGKMQHIIHEISMLLKS